MTSLSIHRIVDPAATGTAVSDVEASIDLHGVVPDQVLDCSVPDIGDLPIQVSGRTARLGDYFEVREGTRDKLVLSGRLAACHAVGGGMQSGILDVVGDVGDSLGRGMRGGKLTVSGNAGRCACSGLRGGTVVVQGSVGDYAAGAAPGNRLGMRGGTLVVQGDCGMWLATRMRRGLVIAVGSVAAGVASRLIAGTVVLCGELQPPIAADMRRGTLLLLGEAARVAEGRVPGFTTGIQAEMSFLPILLRELKSHLPPTLVPAERTDVVMRSLGDRASNGLGELMWYASPVPVESLYTDRS